MNAKALTFVAIISLIIVPSLSAAEYRTVTSEEIISIGYDPRGNPTQGVNLADEHNTSYDDSWSQFRNRTHIEYWEEPCDGTTGSYVTTANSEWDLIVPLTQPDIWHNMSVKFTTQYNRSCIELHSGNTNNNPAYVTEYAILGEGEWFEANIAVEDDNTSSVDLLVFAAAANNVQITVYDDRINAYNGTSVDTVMNATPETWYNIRVTLYYSNNTYTLEINDTLIEVDGTYYPGFYDDNGETESAYVILSSGTPQNINAYIDECICSNTTVTNTTLGGKWIGATIPESRARHNITGSYINIAAPFKLKSSIVGPGVSTLWLRSPIAYKTGMEIKIQVWYISGTSLINITSISVDGPILSQVCNPKTVWSWEYNLNYNVTSFVSLNRTYHKITAPLYPDKTYMISFTASNIATYADIYWTQCDIFTDEISQTRVYDGANHSTLAIDSGISVLVTSTMGGGILGKRLETTDNFRSISWPVDINGTVSNNSYLTFTLPLLTENYSVNEISVSISGYNGSQVAWELYQTKYDVNYFLIISGQIDCADNMTYDRIEIIATFYGSNDPTLWFTDRNNLLLDDSITTNITYPWAEAFSFTPVCSIQITDGVLGLYERPWLERTITVIEPQSSVDRHLSPFPLTMLPGTLATLIVVEGLKWVYDQVEAGARQLYEWVEDGLEWIYDNIVDALGAAGVWLWDHVGVYIYTVVSVVVNAFIDATITLINIALVVIPLIVFSSIVNFWAKFLKSFRVWYTKGYNAYAEYLEREMIHILTVAGRTIAAAKDPRKLLTLARQRARKEYASLTGSGTAAKERAIYKRTKKVIKDTAKTTAKRIRKRRNRTTTAAKAPEVRDEAPKQRSSAKRRFDEQFGSPRQIEEFEWSAEEEEKERLDKELGKKREISA